MALKAWSHLVGKAGKAKWCKMIKSCQVQIAALGFDTLIRLKRKNSPQDRHKPNRVTVLIPVVVGLVRPVGVEGREPPCEKDERGTMVQHDK